MPWPRVQRSSPAPLRHHRASSSSKRHPTDPLCASGSHAASLSFPRTSHPSPASPSSFTASFNRVSSDIFSCTPFFHESSRSPPPSNKLQKLSLSLHSSSCTCLVPPLEHPPRLLLRTAKRLLSSTHSRWSAKPPGLGLRFRTLSLLLRRKTPSPGPQSPTLLRATVLVMAPLLLLPARKVLRSLVLHRAGVEALRGLALCLPQPLAPHLPPSHFGQSREKWSAPQATKPRPS